VISRVVNDSSRKSKPPRSAGHAQLSRSMSVAEPDRVQPGPAKTERVASMANFAPGPTPYRGLPIVLIAIIIGMKL